MAGSKLFISVLNEMARGIKQKMSPKELDTYFKPGRQLKRPGGVSLPLRQDELDFGPWTKVRRNLDENKKYTGNEIADQLEEYWKGRPPVEFTEQNNERNIVIKEFDKLAGHDGNLRPGYVSDDPQFGQDGVLRNYVFGRSDSVPEHLPDPAEDSLRGSNIDPELLRKVQDLRRRWLANRDTRGLDYGDAGYTLPYPRRDMIQKSELLTLLPHMNGTQADHFNDLENVGSWSRLDTRPVIAHGFPDPTSTPQGNLPSAYEGYPKATAQQEFQSDLHQWGRERGYESPRVEVDQAAVNAKLEEMAELISQSPSLLERVIEYGNDRMHSDHHLHIPENATTEEIKQLVLDHLHSGSNYFPQYPTAIPNSNPRYMRMQTELTRLLDNDPGDGEKLPNTPYKGDSWMELEFRKALAHAVDHDHDYLTWTTGDQQIQRWEGRFDKKADDIGWQKNPDGTYDLEPNVAEGYMEDTYDEEENTKKLKPLDLYHLLGEELSQKILNDPAPYGTLRPKPGEQYVPIGGTGMRLNYDTKYGGIAKRYLNTYGEKNPVIEKVRVLGGRDKKLEQKLSSIMSGGGGVDTISRDDLVQIAESAGLHNPAHPLNSTYNTMLAAHDRHREATQLYNEIGAKIDAMGGYERNLNDAQLAEMDQLFGQQDAATRAFSRHRADFATGQADIYNHIRSSTTPNTMWGIRLSPELKDRIRKAGLQYFSALPLAGYGVDQTMNQEQGPSPDGYARGGVVRRMAEGGTLNLSPATITVNPYPNNSGVYGFGPEWDFLKYGYGDNAPPPTTTPPPSTGGGGGGGSGGGGGVPLPPYVGSGGNAAGATQADRPRSVTDISNLLGAAGQPSIPGQTTANDYLNWPDWLDKAWTVASLVTPNMVSLPLTAAHLGAKGYNDTVTDAIRQQQGITGLSIGQVLGSLIGGNDYGSGENQTVANPEQFTGRWNELTGPAQKLGYSPLNPSMAETALGQPYQERQPIFGHFGPTTPAVSVENMNAMVNPGADVTAWDPAWGPMPTDWGGHLLGSTPTSAPAPSRTASAPSTGSFSPTGVYSRDGTLGKFVNGVFRTLSNSEAAQVGTSGIAGSISPTGQVSYSGGTGSGAGGGAPGSYSGTTAGGYINKSGGIATPYGETHGGYSSGSGGGTSGGTSGGLNGGAGEDRRKRGGLVRFARGGSTGTGVLARAQKYLQDVGPAKIIPFQRPDSGVPRGLDPWKPAVDPQELLSSLSLDDGQQQEDGLSDTPGQGQPTVNTSAGASQTPSRAAAGPPIANQGAVPPGYYDRLGMIESSGGVNTTNPRSSATGKFQFLPSTWNDLAKRYPTAGLNDRDIWDDDKQAIAVKLLTEESLGQLRQIGAPINDVTLYALHLLGPTGGVKLVRAGETDPDAPITRYVSPSAFSANRGLFTSRSGKPLTVRETLLGLGTKFSSVQSQSKAG